MDVGAIFRNASPQNLEPPEPHRQPPCDDKLPDGGTGTLTKWEDIERGREKKHAVRAGEARLGDLPGPRRSAVLTARSLHPQLSSS